MSLSRLARRTPLAALVAVAGAVLGLPTLAVAAPAPSGSGAVCSTGAPLGAAQGYTEFVLGDGRRGSESEGAIAYGGSLDAGGMTVGTRLSVDKSFPALVVNGTGKGPFNLQGGSAYVRDLQGGLNLNSGGKRLADPPIDMAKAFADLRARSAAWGRTAANGTAQVVSSETTGTALGGNVLLLRGTDPSLNVFHVTPDQLVGIRATFVDVPNKATALIDVSGSAVAIEGEVRYRSGNTYRQADDTPVQDAVSRTIWNLSEAKTVTLSTGSAFGGTILAPSAAVTAKQVGHNNGQVVAASFSSSFETHQYLFPADGCVPGTDDPTPPVDPPVDPPKGTPELHVAKTVDHDAVAPGDQAVFTVSATNTGTADAESVVLRDLVPVGLTITKVDAGCTIAASLVTCDAGTIAPGQTVRFAITTTAQSLAVPSGGDDQLTVGKVEQQISLPAGAVQTVRVACENGGIAADAAVRVDAVDQGTGDLGSVDVQRLRTLPDGSYEAVVANHASGQAQAKLFVLCLPAATTEGHALLVSDGASQTLTLSAGRHPALLDCGPGRVAIAPSLDVTAGRAHVVASVPTGLSGRRIDVRADVDGTRATVAVRCLSQLTGPAHGTTTALLFTPIAKTVSVPAGAVATEQLVCGDQAKGIVGGWDLEDGLTPLGHEPQPKTRVFTLWNTSGHALGGSVNLLCLDVRTGTPQGVGDVTNTVTGSSSTAQGSGAVLSASASLRIVSLAGEPAAPAAPAAVDAPAVARTAEAAPAAPAAEPATTAAKPAPVAAPSVATVRAATVTRTGVRLSVRCAGDCSGTVVLRTRARLRSGTTVYRAGTKVGTARYAVRHGKAAVVTVKVAPKLARLLKAQRLQVAVTGAGADAPARTATVVARG